jgi:hypothetical protein
MASGSAQAQACFETTIVKPSPFMGNHGELLQTADGGLYEVSGSYEYMYAYSPRAAICPASGKMAVNGKTIRIVALQPRSRLGTKAVKRRDTDEIQPAARGASIEVQLRVRRCNYFLADSPAGLILMEWYGGYDPIVRDGIMGQVDAYGFKDVLYSNGQSGRVYVDDYMLSKDRAIEKFNDKCKQ